MYLLLYVVSTILLIAIVSIEIYTHLIAYFHGRGDHIFFILLNCAILILFFLLFSFFFFSYTKIAKGNKDLLDIQRKLKFIATTNDIIIIQYDVKKRKLTHWSTSTNKPIKEFGIKEYWSRIYPDDLPQAHQVIDFMDSRNNNPYSCEYRYLYPSAVGYTWQYNDIFPFEHDSKNRPVSYIGICRRNERWHEVESQLEKFRQNVSFITSANGIMFIQYNVKNDTLLLLDNSGEQTENIIPFEDYWDSIYPEDLAKAKELIDIMRAHRLERFQTEYRYRLQGQETYDWHVVNIAAIEHDKYHHITSYVCLCRNNNEWRNAMNEMITLRNKAESANKMKNAFLANISHEIRTPLNAVVGFSNMIDDDMPTEERNKYKQIITKNNKMLLQIVDDVLSLSRIESGDIEFMPSSFDINDFIESIVDSVRLVIHDKIVLTCESKEHFNVLLDPRRMTEIISTLLTNANKFTPEGTIKISYNRQDNGLYVAIADTGIGIDKKDQERIFERFEKVNTFVAGTGLGLPICKGIVEQAHGKIGVNSEIGKGATFWFWVPFERGK
jgi:signal transduction histidine kinase